MSKKEKKCLMKKKTSKAEENVKIQILRKTSTINRNLRIHRNVSQLREQKKIKTFTVSHMEGQQLNYARFGFKPVEHTWSM